MLPYIAALKKIPECSDEDNVGKTKQLKQKLQEYYNNHIFLPMLKGMRMLLALEMWFSISSMKNYNPLRTALKTKLSGSISCCKNYA